jgi:succinyl-CoA synthetase beta subunit
VDLFEHQAKELFAEYGVPVPAGKIATTPEEARAIMDEAARRAAELALRGV